MRSSTAPEALDGSEHTEETIRAEEDAQVRAARDGDEAAFQHLYARYRGAVRAVVLTQVGWPDADDLTQDVFVLAWQRLDQLRDPARFGPWLLRCARNRCSDHHRRAKHVRVTSSDHEVRVSMPPRSEALEVLAAIQRMPESYRETLVMRLVEGMSGQEIAEQTGLTHRSVRVNLHRGFKLLRESLGEGQPKGQKGGRS